MSYICSVKQIKKNDMATEIKFLDVVKWVNPMEDVERKDVMVVEDVDKDFLTVRHLSKNGKSVVAQVVSRNVRVVGHCKSTEPIEGIINRYINS